VLLNAIKINTSGAISLLDFIKQHMKSMASFTNEELKKWMIYIGIIIYKDGTIAIYIGSTCAREGAGKRIVLDYEKAL
jgi:hypothetical protein